MADATDLPDDHRAPLWARIVGFVAVVGFLGLLVAVVVIRDRDRDRQAEADVRTVKTYALPPDNGGSLVSRTTTQLPPQVPTTRPTSPRTNVEAALALERVLKRDIGFTHKVSCDPTGPLERGQVLSCHAASEPPIKEAPPSTVYAVVIDDDGRFVWARTEGDGYNLAALTTDPTLSCEGLVGKGYPFVAVLAYWEANGRPPALDPAGTGRPCSAQFPATVIDDAYADAL